jgi:hydrogenase/urease accessory protein HupE
MRDHRAAAVGLALSALVLLLTPDTAFAHSFEPGVLVLAEQAPGVFRVTWTVPGAGSGSGSDSRMLAPKLPAHCRPISQPQPTEADARTRESWFADCGPMGLHGARLSVDGLEATRIDVLVRVSWRDGKTATGVLHSGASEWIVPDDAAAQLARTGLSAWAVLHDYFLLGTEHIVFGTDHLLFVIGLMLLATDRRTLVKTITAFTAAHSLTLALAVLGVVHVPPAPVETLIALSIVLLAAELVRLDRGIDVPPSLTARRPWVLAFLFGLLHGLGFAGALTEIGVPPDQVAVSLVAFNVGVEAGQLAVVLVLLAPITVLRRARWQRPWLAMVPAYAIGSVAMAWTLERLQRFWPPIGL